MENQGNIRTGLRIFETSTGLYIYQVFLPGLIVVLKLKCGSFWSTILNALLIPTPPAQLIVKKASYDLFVLETDVNCICIHTYQKSA